MHLVLWAYSPALPWACSARFFSWMRAKFLLERSLLRGASRLARVVPRGSAHRVPAPLAGPVGIFGIRRAPKRPWPSPMWPPPSSTGRSGFSSSWGVLPERVRNGAWWRVWAGLWMQTVPVRGGKAVPPLQSGFRRRTLGLETSGSNLRPRCGRSANLLQWRSMRGSIRKVARLRAPLGSGY